MYGNGVRTGMARTITRTVQAIILEVQARALTALCAAAAGSTSPGTAVLPIGASTAPRAGTATTVFESYASHSSFGLSFPPCAKKRCEAFEKSACA